MLVPLDFFAEIQGDIQIQPFVGFQPFRMVCMKQPLDVFTERMFRTWNTLSGKKEVKEAKTEVERQLLCHVTHDASMSM